MKYFLDCEFIEDGKTIDLISIGLVSTDGREFYTVNRECDYSKASDWVEENVLVPIGLTKRGFLHYDESRAAIPTRDTYQRSKTREQIKNALLEFLAFQDISKPPEEIYKQCNFWGEWCSYDWVCFCQIFGTMMDLPQGLPMRCNDIIQYAEMFGLTSDDLPASLETEGKHNALLGAKTVKMRYEFIKKLHLGH